MINRHCGSLLSGLLITTLAVGVALLASAYADQWGFGPYAEATTRAMLEIPR